MQVLLVNGSPHEKGCTYTALSHVAKALEQQNVKTKIYWIGNKAIHGCMDCGKCSELHQCILQDNVNAFRELAKEYDGYVFGTPVYYAGMNGSMKAFMDRVFFSDLWGRLLCAALPPERLSCWGISAKRTLIKWLRSFATAAMKSIRRWWMQPIRHLCRHLQKKPLLSAR